MIGEKYIILDRDGVINYDTEDFIKTPDEWKPLPGSLRAIKKLCDYGFLHNLNFHLSEDQQGYKHNLQDKNRSQQKTDYPLEEE